MNPCYVNRESRWQRSRPPSFTIYNFIIYHFHRTPPSEPAHHGEPNLLNLGPAAQSKKPMPLKKAPVSISNLCSQFIKQFFRCVHGFLDFRAESGVVVEEADFREGADEAGNLGGAAN